MAFDIFSYKSCLNYQKILFLFKIFLSFFQILDLPQNGMMERVHRFEQISQLAKEFERTAILYGKIIINEETLDIDQKTIKVSPGFDTFH